MIEPLRGWNMMKKYDFNKFAKGIINFVMKALGAKFEGNLKAFEKDWSGFMEPVDEK